MSKPNFTPGPWYAHKPEESTGWYDITASSLYSDNIAMCFIMADGKVRANATLIAAAPEMYGLLESLLRWCKQNECTGGLRQFSGMRENVDIIETVLKKARGEE